MKEKGVWSLLVCFVAASALVAACAPSTISSPVSVATTSPAVTAAPPGTTPPPENPQYGGTLTFIFGGDLGVFDWVAQGQFMGPVGQLVNEAYLGEDWARGAAGANEIAHVPNITPAPDTCAGILAESWRIPEPGTIVYQVRRGVRWALNSGSEASRLMSGREVTADDWIASFKYVTQHPRSPVKMYAPQLIGTASMEKTGPREVTLKTPVDPLLGWNWLALGGIFPPEVIARYGDMRDWRNLVGTGPFMVTDYVAGSSATMTRNPNYWQKDPVGPGKGNQLPYLDGVKILVTVDISTVQAALRTGKIDFVTGVPAEDLRSTWQAVPGIMSRTYLAGSPTVIAMRTDKAGTPYQDKRVRQALMMATDFDALKNGYYSGQAEILGFPASREATRAYMPLEEMPESVRNLYRCDPAKARQLLSQAGYPDGFSARMVLWNAYDQVELASVYKAMWARAGINLELQPRETAVFLSIVYSQVYDELVMSPLPQAAAYPACLNLGAFGVPSLSHVNDPFIQAARQEIQKYAIVNMPEADRLFRNLMPYIVEQAYYIPVPAANSGSLWWAWLKNYHGETPIRLAAYYWIDRDLKEQMTGRR